MVNLFKTLAGKENVWFSLQKTVCAHVNKTCFSGRQDGLAHDRSFTVTHGEATLYFHICRSLPKWDRQKHYAASDNR